MTALQYDPWADLAGRADLTLSWRHQKPCGQYFHHDRVIALRRGLTGAQARSTLAHELVHAERGDVGLSDAALDARQELIVQREAARRLIPLAALADAVRWTCHPAEAAELLHVDRGTLRTRLAMLTEAEKLVLDAAAGEHEAAA
ncbi:ImmA/IrrE family metallo-endopeptidase [Klenkia marina]|uniref:ImmA/IrrE family metallo-endopeptidase n=1 Tax=Klenkia marina TaxID=1960309 RepID=UPI000B84D79E|nr:ImmA/IrrE family metallo-endopeptidase [Klenkia marina]